MKRSLSHHDCPSACVIGAPVQSSTLRAPRSEPGIGRVYYSILCIKIICEIVLCRTNYILSDYYTRKNCVMSFFIILSVRHHVSLHHKMLLSRFTPYLILPYPFYYFLMILQATHSPKPLKPELQTIKHPQITLEFRV